MNTNCEVKCTKIKIKITYNNPIKKRYFSIILMFNEI